jgi:hypothetical protein
MNEKFNDIRSLIFDGFLKETIKFKDYVIIIRTLFSFEEDSIIETYKHLPNEYNLMAAIDTVQKSVYSINGCKITNESRDVIKDWPKQIIIKLFEEYLKLADRSRKSADLISQFIEIDESKLRWSVVRATKSSLNSAVITGNTDFEFKGLASLQQIWIYLNLQNDIADESNRGWKKAEYISEMICTFINPKAMQKIQNQRKLTEDEETIKKDKDEIMQIENKTNEKILIENTADELFDTMNRRQGESIMDYKGRVQQLLEKAFSEDEHDKIIREHEEYEFAKQLRIKKENARRAKIIYERKITNAIIIETKNTSNLPVAFQQITMLEDDSPESQITGQWIVNNVDYSEVVTITSFLMLKNRDSIFKQITSENEEETTKYIEQYIAEDEKISDVAKKVRDLMKKAKEDETRLDKRERVLSGNNFENRQQEMIKQIQNE